MPDSGTVGVIKAPLVHHDLRPFSSHIAKHNEYSDWEARRYLQLMENGEKRLGALTKRQRRKYQFMTRWWMAPAYFLASYFLKRGFLDGSTGFHFAFFKMWYFWQIRLKILEQRLKDRAETRATGP